MVLARSAGHPEAPPAEDQGWAGKAGHEGGEAIGERPRLARQPNHAAVRASSAFDQACVRVSPGSSSTRYGSATR